MKGILIFSILACLSGIGRQDHPLLKNVFRIKDIPREVALAIRSVCTTYARNPLTIALASGRGVVADAVSYMHSTAPVLLWTAEGGRRSTWQSRLTLPMHFPPECNVLLMGQGKPVDYIETYVERQVYWELWNSEAKLILVVPHKRYKAYVKNSFAILRAARFSGDSSEFYITTRGYIIDFDSTFEKDIRPTPVVVALQQLPHAYTECCGASCLIAGRDAILARVLIQHVYTHYECMAPNYNNLYRLAPKSSFTVAIDPLMQNDADLASVSMPLFDDSPSRRGGLTYLFPHAQDNICLSVRRAKFQSFHESLRNIFPASVWVLLSATIISVTLVLCVQGLSPLNAAFVTFQTTITGALSMHNPKLEIVLSFGCGIVIASAVSGAVSSFLSVPRRWPDLNTVDDVNAGVRKIYVGSTTDPMWRDLGDMRDKMVGLTYKIHWDNAVKRIIAGEPAALLNTQSFLEMQAAPYRSPSGHSQLHIAEECVLSPFYVSLPVSRLSPWASKLKALALRALHSGIISHFEVLSWPFRHRFLDLKRIQPGDSQPEPYPLAFHHVSGIFALWGFGICVGVFAFLMEKLVQCRWLRASFHLRK